VCTGWVGRRATCASIALVVMIVSQEWRVIEGGDTLLDEAMIEARGVSIAGREIGNVWFTRRTDQNFEWMSGFMDRAVDGAIGGNALRFFRVSVDYPGAVAVFEFAGE
jgi:hypothetical protein